MFSILFILLIELMINKMFAIISFQVVIVLFNAEILFGTASMQMQLGCVNEYKLQHFGRH